MKHRQTFMKLAKLFKVLTFGVLYKTNSWCFCLQITQQWSSSVVFKVLLGNYPEKQKIHCKWKGKENVKENKK